MSEFIETTYNTGFKITEIDGMAYLDGVNPIVETYKGVVHMAGIDDNGDMVLMRVSDAVECAYLDFKRMS